MLVDEICMEHACYMHIISSRDACACVILGYCSQKFAFASHYVYPLTANSSEKIYVTLCMGRSKGNSVSFLASGMENCDVHT